MFSYRQSGFLLSVCQKTKVFALVLSGVGVLITVAKYWPLAEMAIFRLLLFISAIHLGWLLCLSKTRTLSFAEAAITEPSADKATSPTISPVFSSTPNLYFHKGFWGFWVSKKRTSLVVLAAKYLPSSEIAVCSTQSFSESNKN